jgi:hypothetical protein
MGKFHLLTNAGKSILKRLTLWHLTLPIGGAIHVAGAVTALPVVARMPDFANCYVAAWAVRNGLPVYDWAAVTQAAAAAGEPLASLPSLPVEYPPLLDYLLVPLTFLPYSLARLVWTGCLLAALWFSAWLLADLFRQPRWLMLAAVMTFSPITLGLAWGNISPLLLLGVLALAKSLASERTRVLDLWPYSLIALVKLFPLAWAVAPLVNRRWNCLAKTGTLVSVLILITTLIRPSLMVDFVNHSLGQTSAPMGRQHEVGSLGGNQLNILGLVMHLTQPTTFNYSRFGVSYSTRTIPALAPMSPGAARAVAFALMAVALALLTGVLWKMARQDRAVDSLWVLITGLLVVQPYTEYHYLAATLPALLFLALSPDRRFKWLFSITYIGIGVSRFTGLLTAILPAPLFLVGAHCGTLAVTLVALGVYLRGSRPQAGSC